MLCSSVTSSCTGSDSAHGSRGRAGGSRREARLPPRRRPLLLLSVSGQTSWPDRQRVPGAAVQAIPSKVPADCKVKVESFLSSKLHSGGSGISGPQVTTMGRLSLQADNSDGLRQNLGKSGIKTASPGLQF